MLNELTKYYGVRACVAHKTIGFQEKETIFSQSSEPLGACGICYWFGDLHEALNKTAELVSAGYALYRMNDYPNYYAEIMKQSERKEQLRSISAYS